jgi:hypothetical protein
MRKRVAISFVCQVATLLLVLTTGFGPSLAGLQQSDVSGISYTADEEHAGQNQTAGTGDRDQHEIAAAPDATLPVAPLHLNILSGFTVSTFHLIKLPVPDLLNSVAPATGGYFKVLFRRIISPNAP